MADPQLLTAKARGWVGGGGGNGGRGGGRVEFDALSHLFTAVLFRSLGSLSLINGRRGGAPALGMRTIFEISFIPRHNFDLNASFH